MLLAILPSTAAARAQAAAPSNLTFEGGESFGVPLELVDNRIFVEVWLEGRGPFKFILDTGGYGGLSVETARRVGLKLGNEVEGRGAGESVVKAWETSVKETRIGGGTGGSGSAGSQSRSAGAGSKAGLVLRDQDFRVFDFSDMRHVFGSEVFDGVIGLPVFSQAVVRVDYERRRLTFTKPSSFEYRGAAAGVPFELERYLPIVRGEVDGSPVRLGLDTGDRSAFTLKGPFVEEHRLRERYAPKVEAVTGWGIGGPIRAQVVRLSSLKFAGFEIKEPVTRLSLQRSGAFAAGDTAGNVGGAILKQFTVTFDYTRRRLFFEKGSAYGRRLTYDRAGLWLSRSADGRAFEVYDVVAHGPSDEAGLKVGERVVAVDGKGVESLKLIATRDELKDARRRSVRLTVQTGATTREVVVRLRDLV
ncbi:MAG TPA: PDZ domain-containing protein [Pyrinomonadaceae bacterium]|nr:PDZ domain-containing protein [Pyrinomonadaceae bacterium]